MLRCVLRIIALLAVGLQAASCKSATPPKSAQATNREVDFGPDDPVRTNPDQYKVEFENDHVRIVRAIYGPKHRGILHEHRCGRVAVNLTPLHEVVTRPSGERVEVREKFGEAGWSEPDRHFGENLEEQPFEVLYVDIKSACIDGPRSGPSR
jgi:hypothetical protein